MAYLTEHASRQNSALVNKKIPLTWQINICLKYLRGWKIQILTLPEN